MGADLTPGPAEDPVMVSPATDGGTGAGQAAIAPAPSPAQARRRAAGAAKSTAEAPAVLAVPRARLDKGGPRAEMSARDGLEVDTARAEVIDRLMHAWQARFTNSVSPAA